MATATKMKKAASCIEKKKRGKEGEIERKFGRRGERIVSRQEQKKHKDEDK